MIERQQRIAWIEAVLEEYLAASTAADLLAARTKIDPSFGNRHGWTARAGVAFAENLEATYIIRIYTEFEAALRDYWLRFLKKLTRPKMFQLVNEAIPDQRFSVDVVDHADEIRVYRNYLVHDNEDEAGGKIVPFSVQESKSRLCAYLGCLNPRWR